MTAGVAFDRKALARWRANPTAFVEEVLVDPETGRPFVLLPAERDFLKLAFVTGPDGRLLYPEMVYSAPKKSGKTTFGGIIAITMVVLHGGAYPEAICAANDHEQSVGRVFTMIKRIVAASPLLQREAKVGADKITFPAFHDATISAIAVDAAGAAGGNPVISIFDELWGSTSERARRLFDEQVPSPARKISCRLTVTYAGFADESVLLEELYKRGLQQPEIAPSLRAGDGILMFWSHVPVAPWQTEAWLADMRRSLRPAQYLRMIENRFVTTESSFIDMAAWDGCVDPSASPVVTDRSLPVWVGIDASVKHDSTGIVAVTWDDKAKKVQLVWHRIFQPSAAEPLDFEAAVENTVRDLRLRFRIMRVLFDPWQMQATSQRLAREGIRIEEFPQSVPNLTAASQNLFELIQGRNLVLYPDAAMRLAVSRAAALETARGWRIAKEKQSHKIDVIVALAMAAHAAVQGQAKTPMVLPENCLADIIALSRRGPGERALAQERRAQDRRLYGFG
jgi:phage terminase large subunit-like protein